MWQKSLLQVYAKTAKHIQKLWDNELECFSIVWRT